MKITKQANIILLLFLFCILISLVSCNREEFKFNRTPDDYKIGNITYSGNTIILEGDELLFLKDVSADQLTFNTGSAIINKILEGNVIITGISEKTPFGLLRKVNHISKDDSEIVFHTSDARMEDAIESGTINLQEILTASNFNLINKDKSIASNSSGKAFNGLVLQLNDFEMEDNSNNKIYVAGVLGISPEINLFIKFNSYNTEIVEIQNKLTKIDELNINSETEISGQYNIELAHYIYKPIIIDKVVITPILMVEAGFDGYTNGAFSEGVRQERIITASANYTNEVWNDEISHAGQYDIVVPSLGGSSEITVYTRIKMDILIFGQPADNFNMTSYEMLTASLNYEENWRLELGIDGAYGILPNIIGSNEGCNFLLNEIAPQTYTPSNK